MVLRTSAQDAATRRMLEVYDTTLQMMWSIQNMTTIGAKNIETFSLDNTPEIEREMVSNIYSEEGRIADYKRLVMDTVLAAASRNTAHEALSQYESVGRKYIWKSLSQLRTELGVSPILCQVGDAEVKMDTFVYDTSVTPANTVPLFDKSHLIRNTATTILFWLSKQNKLVPVLDAYRVMFAAVDSSPCADRRVFSAKWALWLLTLQATYDAVEVNYEAYGAEPWEWRSVLLAGDIQQRICDQATVIDYYDDMLIAHFK